jgi:predicted SprT family Zn-dependent metalloprotease
VSAENPDESFACQSPYVVDLVDSSSGESEEEEAPPTTRKASSKKPDSLIELLSSSSSSSDSEVGFDEDDSSDRSSYASESSDGSEASIDENLSVSPAATRKFLRQRKSIAERIFVEYDRAVFKGALTKEGACTLKWSKRLLTTAGLTRNHRGGKSTVVLSTSLIDRDVRLRFTLMHELCHAAAWIVDGCSKPPHGEVFRKWGARAERLVPGMKVGVTHDYKIEYKHTWKCQNAECGEVYGRTRRCIDVNRHRCGKCKSHLVELVKPAKPKAPPSEYQRFVQDNSASVRRELEAASAVGQPAVASATTTPKAAKVSQSEVMKECARLWQARKALSATPK